MKQNGSYKILNQYEIQLSVKTFFLQINYSFIKTVNEQIKCNGDVDQILEERKREIEMLTERKVNVLLFIHTYIENTLFL